MSAINGVMLQGFDWYTPADGRHWNRLNARAADLAAAGFSAIWMPPAYKGLFGKDEVGYGVYDLYDLGEFDQKGTIRTKYGTKQEYLDAIKALKRYGIDVYADAVLNHKMSADGVESFMATPYTQFDRLNPIGQSRRIEGYTHFSFPGRNKAHSEFEWHWWHFDAIDHNVKAPNDYSTIYLMEGNQFDDHVALERGNYAYLMGCDLDYENQEVRDEITRWGKWYLDTTGVDGFRLDAIKHISAWFFPQWIDEMERHAGKDLFIVGEYWKANVFILHWYLNAVQERMAVFDVPLHYNFYAAGKSGPGYDMRNIMSHTLMQQRPMMAVTFVENHDSQPLQALESTVEPWFKPLAYALILLQQSGYPCVFLPDYDGATYTDRGHDGGTYTVSMASHRWMLDRFLHARRRYASGGQIDYFDHPNTVGFTRMGTDQHPGGMAVLMSNGHNGHKWMRTGQPGQAYRDLTQHIPGIVTTNKQGWGRFECLGGKVSVWIPAE